MPHDGPGPMLPVHQFTPLFQAHGPDFSSKISRTTLSLPLCRYNRTTRASLLFELLSLLTPFALIENGGHAVGLGLLPSLNSVVVDLEPGGRFGHRLLALLCLQYNFDLKGQVVLSVFSGHFPRLFDRCRCSWLRNRVPIKVPVQISESTSLRQLGSNRQLNVAYVRPNLTSGGRPATFN